MCNVFKTLKSEQCLLKLSIAILTHLVTAAAVLRVRWGRRRGQGVNVGIEVAVQDRH